MILLLKVCEVNYFMQKKEKDVLILLNYVYFQIVKRYFFYKIILMKTGSAVALKFGYGSVQPERFSQIKLQADLLEGVEYLMGARFLAVILDHGILYHSVVFPFLGPQTKHAVPPFLLLSLYKYRREM